MDLGLAGKRAVVCGSSRGLGFAVARSLLAEGARVVLCSRRHEALATAADRLASLTGSRPEAVAADLTVATDRERLVAESERLLGGIDILLANAGGPPVGPFESHGAENWRLAFELAVGSLAHLCRLVLPGMRARRFGRIVQIVSIAGLEAIDGLVLSHASRPAALGVAKALAREAAADGVLVNSICPGIFLTDRVRDIAARQAAARGIGEEEFIREFTADIPLGRPGNPEEVGDLAAFLCSPRNTYITGAAIVIDGGKTRRLW